VTLDGVQAFADNETLRDQHGVRVTGARRHGLVIRHPGSGVEYVLRTADDVHALLEELRMGLTTCPVS
jgi:hypothetical protein